MDAVLLIISALTPLYLLYRLFIFVIIHSFQYIILLSKRYAISTFNYFSDQGIQGPKPLPIFGNLWGIWRQVKLSFINGIIRIKIFTICIK